MTIDKKRLKALAEAATPGPWIADNERHEGAINTTDRHIGMVSLYAETREGVSQNFVNQEFIAAANPATILALLGEIEHLIESRQEARELRNKMGDRLDAAESERDALQTQVAALQAEPNSYQSGYDAGRAAEKAHADNWRAEAEGMRKDAERYRALRVPTAEKIGVSSPFVLDALVDAAIAREQSHDH